MKMRLFVVPVLLFALASSGFAQVDHPLIKNKPDAPLQITEAHCGPNAPGSPAQGSDYCHVTLQFADTKDTWDGYGLVWILTYEDGKKYPHYHSADRSIEPTGDHSGSYRPSGRSFKPREIVDVGTPYGGIGFGVKDRNEKPVRLTGAEVEVEFVVNTNGTVWGDASHRTICGCWRTAKLPKKDRSQILEIRSHSALPSHPYPTQTHRRYESLHEGTGPRGTASDTLAGSAEPRGPSKVITPRGV